VLAAVALGLIAATDARAARSEVGCPAGAWIDTGEATFYDAFAQPNACSFPLAPGESVVAVALASYAGSAVCGRCLRIYGPRNSIVSRIVDYCDGPGCRDLDLDEASFAAIADPSDGIVPVAWESASCDVEGPISFAFDPTGNSFFASIQVRNHRYGVDGLEVRTATSAEYTSLTRASYNEFTFSPGTMIESPLSFRVTSRHGEVVTETGIDYAPGTEAAGATQFTPCPEPSSRIGGAVAVAVALVLRDPRRRKAVPPGWKGSAHGVRGVGLRAAKFRFRINWL
jgi:expansin (peptidoglycan-binding protein)